MVGFEGLSAKVNPLSPASLTFRWRDDFCFLFQTFRFKPWSAFCQLINLWTSLFLSSFREKTKQKHTMNGVKLTRVWIATRCCEHLHQQIQEFLHFTKCVNTALIWHTNKRFYKSFESNKHFFRLRCTLLFNPVVKQSISISGWNEGDLVISIHHTIVMDESQPLSQGARLEGTRLDESENLSCIQ